MKDSELLKSTRLKLNLNQPQMAKVLGYVNRKEISALENG